MLKVSIREAFSFLTYELLVQRKFILIWKVYINCYLCITRVSVHANMCNCKKECKIMFKIFTLSQGQCNQIQNQKTIMNVANKETMLSVRKEEKSILGCTKWLVQNEKSSTSYSKAIGRQKNTDRMFNLVNTYV